MPRTRSPGDMRRASGRELSLAPVRRGWVKRWNMKEDMKIMALGQALHCLLHVHESGRYQRMRASDGKLDLISAQEVSLGSF